MNDIKTEYEYINFEKIADKPKTSVFICLSKNNDTLGYVRWYASWRQYCFFPMGNAVFSLGCLEDVNNFISQLMNERKNKAGNNKIKHYNCGEMGTFENKIHIKMPDYWETTRKDRYFHVDPCIAPEIVYLVINGVRTIASCCGHNEASCNVAVDEKSISLMLDLRYLNDPSYPERNDIFLLKGDS